MNERRQRVLLAAFAAGLLAVLVLSGCHRDATPTFANPQLLVETHWLADHVNDDDLRIVDAREAEDYQLGHVPGALSLPRSATFAPARPNGTVGQPAQIAALFGSKGIDEKVHVVVYDEGRSTAAPRVFWTLEYYGHHRVSVLNGGLEKWETEGRELTTEELDVTPVTFTIASRRSNLSTRELILEGIGEPHALMLDARSPEEYRGENVRAKRGGHIPGAVNIDWRQNFTGGEVPVFKPAAALTKIYEEAGVTKDKDIHAY